MKQIGKLVLASALIFSTHSALAAQRVWSPKYSCQTMKQMVIDRGSLLVSFPLRTNNGFALVFSKHQRQQCIRNASYNYCKTFYVPTSDMASCAIGYVESMPPNLKWFRHN
nr:hypothetical protein [uncultured Cohaesibacter sp.]